MWTSQIDFRSQSFNIEHLLVSKRKQKINTGLMHSDKPMFSVPLLFCRFCSFFTICKTDIATNELMIFVLFSASCFCQDICCYAIRVFIVVLSGLFWCF